jgi:hypothetical protein
MAGLASMQRSCYGNDLPAGTLNGFTQGASVFAMSDGFNNCQKVFRFYWFIFAFVIVTLLGLAITTATPMGLHFSRPFWIGMLTLCTLLMMIATEAFLGLTWPYQNVNTRQAGGQQGQPAGFVAQSRTTTAGAIISVVTLILLLMAVGTDWDNRRGGTYGDDKVVGPAGAPGTGLHHPHTGVRTVDAV